MKTLPVIPQFVWLCDSCQGYCGQTFVGFRIDGHLGQRERTDFCKTCDQETKQHTEKRSDA